MKKRFRLPLRRRIVPAIWIAALLGSSGNSAWAGEKISIMVGGIEKQIYLPVKLAEQLGYFSDSGLDISFLTDRNGINAETELLSGAVQGVVGFYDHTINLQARGKLVQSVIQLTITPGEAIVVSENEFKRIPSLEHIGGSSFGVTGLGSSTNNIIRYLAKKNGIKISSINIVPVGAGDNFINALAEGRAQAGISSEPTVSRLVSSGRARVLLDLRSVRETQATFGGPYPAACLYMPTAWVRTHRDEVHKIVQALSRALSYIQSHSAAEISEQMPASYFANDKENYVLALKNSKEMFSPDGKMPESGPATVLNVLKDFDRNVQGKSINLQNTFTNEFIPVIR